MAHETTDSPRYRHDASPAAVIAVGGLDSSGAAGLVRDFLTASALGASAHLVATAWTLQIPGGVQAVESRPASSVQADLVGAIAGVRPGAVKVGMVASGAIAEAIVSGLAGFGGAVVYDPVIRASSGGQLFAGNERALRSLLTRATLVTPNLAEAAALSGRPVASAEDARAAGEVLLGAGARAVLIKGGHFAGVMAEDLLVTAAGVRVFSAPRLPGDSPRGTGCALATAIAVGLARGEVLADAIAAGKTWLHEAIARATVRGGQRVL